MTQQADILVSATGVPGLITADMVKPGAAVIDVGITRVTDSEGRAKLVGDVNYEGRSQAALYRPRLSLQKLCLWVSHRFITS